MLKINFLCNVRKVNFKVDFKADRVLALSWRISLKTRFPRVSYIFNQLIYDIYHISFNIYINIKLVHNIVYIRYFCD